MLISNLTQEYFVNAHPMSHSWEFCLLWSMNLVNTHFLLLIWKKVYCTYYLFYIIGADFKSYLEITCGCSLHASYWRTMPFIFCKPCNCIHIETYWRKVISLFTYTYISMLYISECRNIFKILINTVNRTIFSNLTISIHVWECSRFFWITIFWMHLWYYNWDVRDTQ